MCYIIGSSLITNRIIIINPNNKKGGKCQIKKLISILRFGWKKPIVPKIEKNLVDFLEVVRSKIVRYELVKKLVKVNE